MERRYSTGGRLFHEASVLFQVRKGAKIGAKSFGARIGIDHRGKRDILDASPNGFEQRDLVIVHPPSRLS